MQELNDKVDGGGGVIGVLPAAEWNQVPTEIQNIITAFGQSLSAGDLNQLGKAIAGYVANGSFYADTGGSNAYVLNTSGGTQGPTSYVDGMVVRFGAGSLNTGNATVDVNGLGVKDIRQQGGTDLTPGMINNRVELIFNSANDRFELFEPTLRTGEGIIVYADSDTADPPIEVNSPKCLVQLRASDGNPIIAELGFNGNSELRIHNAIQGGKVNLDGVSTAGSQVDIILADPDSATSFFYGGNEKFQTASDVNGGALLKNLVTGSGFERVLTTSDLAKANITSAYKESDQSFFSVTTSNVTDMAVTIPTAGGAYAMHLQFELEKIGSGTGNAIVAWDISGVTQPGINITFVRWLPSTNTAIVATSNNSTISTSIAVEAGVTVTVICTGLFVIPAGTTPTIQLKMGLSATAGSLVFKENGYMTFTRIE